MKYRTFRAVVAAVVVASGLTVVSAQETIVTPLPEAGDATGGPGYVDIADGGSAPGGSAEMIVEEPGMILDEAGMIVQGSGMVVQGPMMDPAMIGPPPYAPKCYCCEPKSFWPAGEMSFTITADSLVLTRVRPDRQTIIVNNSTSTQSLGSGDDVRRSSYSEILGAQDLDPDYRYGARIAVAWHPDGWHDLEFVYFGMDTWAAASAVTGDADDTTGSGAFLFRPPGSILTTNRVALTQLSDLGSYEVNAWGWQWPWLSLAAGIRFVDLDDSFYVNPGTGATEGFVYIVENNMVGFQLAARALLWERDAPFSADCFGKVGAYYNRVDLDARRVLIGSPDADPGSARDSEDQGTLVAEMGIRAKLRIYDWLSIEGGYQVMWLEGIALSPAQVPVTNVSQRAAVIDAGDGTVYHGAFFGVMGEF